jgi:hypothetical protein
MMLLLIGVVEREIWHKPVTDEVEVAGASQSCCCTHVSRLCATVVGPMDLAWHKHHHEKHLP